MERKNYSEITPEIMNLAEFCSKNDRITPDLFLKYQVNRGLRDVSGKGVLTGLTDISDIRSTCLQSCSIVCAAPIHTESTASVACEIDTHRLLR